MIVDVEKETKKNANTEKKLSEEKEGNTERGR